MDKPIVGLFVIVLNEKERKVLLLEDKNDMWVFPGRELEMFVYSEDSARAVIKKDLGLDMRLIDTHPHEVIETISRKKSTHYFTGVIRARYADFLKSNLKIDKNKYNGYQWCRWNLSDLPRNSISSIKKLIECGYNPF